MFAQKPEKYLQKNNEKVFDYSLIGEYIITTKNGPWCNKFKINVGKYGSYLKICENIVVEREEIENIFKESVFWTNIKKCVIRQDRF